MEVEPMTGEYEILVCHCSVKEPHVGIVVADGVWWRSNDDGWSLQPRDEAAFRDPTPYTGDADALWAELVAWRLTHG